VAHVRCLLACGAATDIKDEETKVTALSLARQFGLTEIAQLIVKHRAAAKKKSENDSKKNEAKKRKSPEPKSEDSEESEDEEEDAQPANRKKAKKTTVTTKAKKEKVKKEVSSEKQEELALEADVRRLAKLDKTDMFSLRQLLRKSACMKPSEMPKLEMLRAAMEWLTNGNAHPSLTDQ
jgi:pyruvate/2-oxoglutarate dehydrogenase complex dihydrolipoamide acyltransferase (E2) component